MSDHTPGAETAAELDKLKAINAKMLEALEELLIWEPRCKDEGERHAYDLAYEAVRLATRQP